jgi:hypothetical protein
MDIIWLKVASDPREGQEYMLGSWQSVVVVVIVVVDQINCGILQVEILQNV